MSKEKYLVFGQPRISEEEIAAVADVLRSGWIGTGPRSVEFEKAFAAKQGVAHAAAVSSCTAALILALRAYGIGPGDEVVTTAMTFAATVNAIIHVGAKPIVVDIERGSMSLDLSRVEEAITRKTKAIVPVHFAGAPADVDGLLRLREKHGLKIIHDCAHAIETLWHGKPVGSYADACCYSFYSTKNITTVEGGMVCSNDELLVQRVKLLSNHGLSKDAWKRFSSSGYQHYDVVAAGYKLNFTDVQAALGLGQLAKIDSKLERRGAVWSAYQKAFATQPFERPREVPAPHRHARHLYTILVDEKSCGISRDATLTALHALGVGCGVHYRAIPSMSYFNEALKLDPRDYPNAVRVGDSTLSLPLTPYLSDADVARVIGAVEEIMSGGSRQSLAV